MKYSLALFAALAASTSVSATPSKRVYTLADAFLSSDAQNVASSSSLTTEAPEVEFPYELEEIEDEPLQGSPVDPEAASFSPLGALLTRLGFAADHSASAVSADARAGVDEESLSPSVFEEWKTHVEEMFNDAMPTFEEGHVGMWASQVEEGQEDAEDSDELNDVKWWRVVGGGKWEVKDGNGEWRSPHHNEKPPMGKPVPKSTRVQAQESEKEGRLEGHRHHRHHHLHHNHSHAHHQHRAQTLTGRLQRVVLNLQSFEVITFCLVLGAGLGAIAHTVFLFVLLSYRRIASGKQQLVSQLKSRKAGPIRLDGEDSLPDYAEAEEEEFVEKA